MCVDSAKGSFTVELVADINPGPADSRPFDLTAFQGQLFVSATAASGNRALWVLNDSPTGASPVTDVSMIDDVFGLTVFDNRLFFSADEAATGSELWASDGTPGGTALFKDIRPGFTDSNPWLFSVIAGQLIFEADFNLWRSDGTVPGTIPLLDNTGHHPEHPRNLIPVNGVGIFTSTTATGRRVLFRTDGTEAGTFVISGLETDRVVDGFGGFLTIGSDAFFTTTERDLSDADPKKRATLWRTDGTESGTELVKILPLNKNARAVIGTELNGEILFSVEQFTGQDEVWISDGTDPGTRKLTDLPPDDTESDIRGIVTAGDRALIAVRPPEGQTTSQLWMTDGTPEGIELIQTFLPGSADRVRIESQAAFGDFAVLVLSYEVLTFDEFGRKQEFFRELWLSDGTSAGTYPVFVSGVPNARLNTLGVFDDQLYFLAASAADGLGEEVYRLIPEPSSALLLLAAATAILRRP